MSGKPRGKRRQFLWRSALDERPSKFYIQGVNPEPIALLWSGGKDSALALRELRADPQFDVRVLLTTVTQDYDRISIHGVRRALLEAQTAALGVSLQIVAIPPHCTNAQYETAMGAAMQILRAQNITRVAAGDLFLRDVRDYREAMLSSHGMRAHFPLWNRDTGKLAREFIGAGYKAILSCVDTHVLAARFAGRAFDVALLRDLPPNIDPCGENGEFHSFVWDGPDFSAPVKCQRGEVVVREERFAFCDLLMDERRVEGQNDRAFV